MADLEQFRAETRAWLEANCPAEMRTPMRGEKDLCWGGRHFEFQIAGAEAMAGRHGVARLDRARLAQGIWRRRPDRRPKPRSSRRKWRALGCRPPLTSFGISMLGPALLKYRQ